MLAGKKLIDFTIMFSPYDFDKNDQVISNYFKDEWNWPIKLDWSDKSQTK